MRINCHAHIFNATSIFTTSTLDILLKRITEMNIPGLIKNELAKQVGNLLTKAGGYVDEEALFRDVIEKVTATSDFKNMLESLSPGDSLRLELSGGARLEEYAVEKLVSLLGRIGEAVGKDTEEDATKSDIEDAISFLRIALLPGIRQVTETLMEQVGPEDGIVALTMDITHDGSNRQLLEKQLTDTAAQVLAYPGRIFPFVAVNSRRPEHFSLMEAALNGQGFIGVKLYPSLGFAIDSPELFKVYAYCEEREIPLLMHCSEGGFYYSDETRGNSDPVLWQAILEKHDKLKICFGHFGGAKNLTSSAIPETCWTSTILNLMEQYEGVYADIAFHSEPMEGGQAETNYFANLTRLLKEVRYRSRVLFGTDYFLSRQRLTETSYRDYFRSHLSPEDFEQISELNPAAYLGFPTAERKASQSLENHVRFMYQQRDSLLAEASDWVKSALKVMYGPDTTLPKPSLGPKWSWNNKVHAYIYAFLAQGQLSDRQKAQGFDATGMLKLRDLAYWNRGFEAKEIWSLKLKAMAENMDSFILANGGSYEKNQTTKNGLATLQNLFDDGSRYIHEAGEVCDAIYLFP
jgi:predicted TIM-barrel fold metal-dependent hydrolase